MAVREARVCELSACLDIAKAGFTRFSDRFGAGFFVDLLGKPGSRLLVDAPGAGVVRGFVLLQRYPTGVVVRLIATDPDYQRQGVGRRLLVEVKGRGSAWVRSENVASRGLFTSQGWIETIAPRRRKGDWVFYTHPGRA